MARESSTKEKLLTAALELIWEQSYHAVGVDAICERSGVKKGSFYHFFNSKAELAAEAIQCHWEGYKAELNTIFSPTVPPLQRLSNYLDSVYAYHSGRKECVGHVCGCPYFDLGAEAATLEASIVVKVTGVLDEFFRFFDAAVREAQARGDIAVSDPAASARWLFNYFEGALMNARIHNDPELLKDLAAGAMQFLGVSRNNA
jgi:TetR/AcrR family transcriptional regulator, transcriptional repressor for nem operon